MKRCKCLRMCDASSVSDSSDSSSEESEGYVEDGLTENGEIGLGRAKREISWCGVDTEESGPTLFEQPPGNPAYSNRVQLYCKTGYHLAVFPDKRVRGVDDDVHPNAIMQFSSAGTVGHVRIKAVETNLYVAMNKAGRLYGEVNPYKESTVFIEELLGPYVTYMSRRFAHLGWYIGINKAGKVKRGRRTGWGQNSIKFLHRRNV